MKISLRRSPCPGRQICPVDEGERLGAALCHQLISAPWLPYLLFENGQLWQFMLSKMYTSYRTFGNIRFDPLRICGTVYNSEESSRLISRIVRHLLLPQQGTRLEISLS